MAPNLQWNKCKWCPAKCRNRPLYQSMRCSGQPFFWNQLVFPQMPSLTHQSLSRKDQISLFKLINAPRRRHQLAKVRVRRTFLTHYFYEISIHLYEISIRKINTRRLEIARDDRFWKSVRLQIFSQSRPIPPDSQFYHL